jgi:hypothetical protein
MIIEYEPEETEHTNEGHSNVLIGANSITLDLGPAKGSKDCGEIKSGKITFFLKPGIGYGVRINLIDFEGGWCSNAKFDNHHFQYFIELW